MTTGRRKRMSQIVLGTALGAASIVSEQAWTQEAFPRDLPYQCTLENVSGVFGFNQETRSSPGAGEARAFVGLIDLHSDGTALLQNRGFRERGGEPREGQILEGEWTVEPSCFGLIDFPEVDAPAGSTVEFDFLFVAVENGTELFFISNNPLEEADAKLLFRR
jgi:hypothetical protein